MLDYSLPVCPVESSCDLQCPWHLACLEQSFALQDFQSDMPFCTPERTLCFLDSRLYLMLQVCDGETAPAVRAGDGIDEGQCSRLLGQSCGELLIVQASRILSVLFVVPTVRW